MTLVGVGDGTVTRRVFADIVSANYFEAFGSPLTLGRAFTPAEEEPDAIELVRRPREVGHPRAAEDVRDLVRVARHDERHRA